MNKVIKIYLLAGDKVMPEMHLRQHAALCKPRFTYSALGPFTKNRKFAIYSSNWARQSLLSTRYNDFKNLRRRTPSDKVLHDIIILLKI